MATCTYAGCGCINYNDDLMGVASQMIFNGNCVNCGHPVNAHPRKPAGESIFPFHFLIID